jgi:hypothetical protein
MLRWDMRWRERHHVIIEVKALVDTLIAERSLRIWIGSALRALRLRLDSNKSCAGTRGRKAQRGQDARQQ